MILIGKQHDVKVRFSVNRITHHSRRNSNVRNVIIIIITSRI